MAREYVRFVGISEEAINEVLVAENAAGATLRIVGHSDSHGVPMAMLFFEAGEGQELPKPERRLV